MPIELLCFDLDDTLWPCLPTIARAEQRLYAWMQQHVPQITAGHTIDSLREQRIALLQRQPHLQTDLSEARRVSLRELGRQFGIGEDWVEPAFQVFYRSRQQVSLFDDVAPALDRLKTRYRMVSISNGNADIHLTGVAGWFEFHLPAAQVGHAKPDTEIFRALLRQAGVDAAAAVMVGDHPQHDILGAAQAGMRTVWVNRHRHQWPLDEVQPDAEIIDFGCLADVLSQLAGC